MTIALLMITLGWFVIPDGPIKAPAVTVRHLSNREWRRHHGKWQKTRNHWER